MTELLDPRTVITLNFYSWSKSPYVMLSKAIIAY